MYDFSHILQKIITTIPIETTVRDFLVKYLEENYMIKIDRKNIHLRKNIIELRISPIIRAKFNPYSTECLERLNEYLKEKEIQMIIKKII